MSSAAYRRHVPRQWRVLVTARWKGHGRQRLGWYQVNASTAAAARGKAIALAREQHARDIVDYAGTAKLANR